MKLFPKKQRKSEDASVRSPRINEENNYAFRRSRTLTGSVSSAVKTANESQAQLKSPRIKAHELRHHRRRVGVGLVVCLAIAGVLYWLLTQYVVSISLVRYAPVVAVSPQAERYSDLMQEYLRERPFERFRFALDIEKLTEFVQAKAPEVAVVQELAGDKIGTATATIQLRQPVVGWKVGEKQYYVDAEGAPFTTNYFGAPAVTVRDQSGIRPDATSGAIASNRFLSFLGRIVVLTHEMKVGNVATVVIPPGAGTRTVEIRLKGKPMPIRLHIDRDPAAQVEDVKRALAFFQARGETPRYIDVRVAGRAFYR